MNNREYATLSPYIAVTGAGKAIEFYQNILGAKERSRLADASGRVCHSELVFGDTVLMIAEEFEGYSKSPTSIGGTAVRLCLEVDNVDQTVARAVEAGATLLQPASDQFYGFRSASIRDPFGHEWMIQHQFERVEPAEMQRRFTEMCEKMSKENKS